MRHYITHATLFTVLLLSVAVHSDDPVSSSVTFNREVVRIFQRKCFQCHAPGGVAMSLATYREARPWARAIREELVEQRMPPWGAAPGYTPLAHDAGLTAREMTMLLTWLDGGVPRGEERDFPRNTEPAAASSRPDRLLTLPVQTVPDGEHVVRRVTIPATGFGGRAVQRLELRDVDRRVLRGALFWTTSRTGRQWIGAWTPWQDAVSAPAGSAFAVTDDATLDIELHYRGQEGDRDYQPSLAVFYAAAGTASFVRDIRLQAESGNKGSALRRTTATLRAAARVWGIAPDTQTTATTGGSLEITARTPEGVVQVLLWVPQYRHDWPTPYILREPVPLPAGTTITLTTSIGGFTAASVVATPGEATTDRSVLR